MSNPLALPYPFVTDPEARHLDPQGVQDNFDTIALATGPLTTHGTFTTYTPAWTATGTQPAIGNGTLTGRYCQIGKLIVMRANLIAGSTTTYGTGTYAISLPVTAAAGYRWALSCDVVDTGTQHYTGVAVIAASGTTTEEILVGSNSVGPTNWAATSPFTFGNTDRIVFSGMYEAV